jgi:hypothetical protein
MQVTERGHTCYINILKKLLLDYYNHGFFREAALQLGFAYYHG